MLQRRSDQLAVAHRAIVSLRVRVVRVPGDGASPGRHPSLPSTAALADKIAPLTAAESTVLGLVAKGWSNKMIAQHLTVTEQTIGKHLEHIFGKLGVHTRTAAADWLWRQDRHSPLATYR